MTLREDILNADDRPLIPLEVPEWKKTIHLRAMSGAERDRYMLYLETPAPAPAPGAAAAAGTDDAAKEEEPAMLRSARLLAMTIVEEDGTRSFDPDSAADLELLNGRNGAVLDRLVGEVAEINGLTADEVKDAEEN